MTDEAPSPPEPMSYEEFKKVEPRILAELEEIAAAANAEAKKWTCPPKTLQEVLDFMTAQRERNKQLIHAVWTKYCGPGAGWIGTKPQNITVADLEARIAEVRKKESG
jgi:hypothetical protein